MVLIVLSQTFPINPPGVEPVLSIEQVWEVLNIKSHTPELFIQAMASSTVFEESKTSLVREVVFREDGGPVKGGKVIEDLTFVKPWKVDFQARGNNGSFISNLVSQGKDETDLYLTFYFEWNLPEVEEGSEEAKRAVSQRWAMVREVVQETIDIGRKLVKDGKIKL